MSFINQDNPAASRNRKHAARACDQCRSGRARCTGARPCGRCRDYGLHCTDTAILKKRGRPKKSQCATDSYVTRCTADRASAVNQEQPTGAGISDPSFDSSTPSQVSLDTDQFDTVEEGGWSHLQRPNSAPSPTSPVASDENNSNSIRDDAQTAITVTRSEATHFRPPLSPPRHPQLNGLTPSFVRADCRYPFLIPALPFLAGSMSVFMACDLLDTVLMDPGVSLFHCVTPFLPTRIFRKESLASPFRPRVTSPVLIVTMLWCAAHTADIPALQRPGARTNMVSSLHTLTLSLLESRSKEPVQREASWNDINDNENAVMSETSSSHRSIIKATTDMCCIIDDVLTHALIAWWSKAIQLSYAADLHRIDANNAFGSSSNEPYGSTMRPHDGSNTTIEEARRLFYLLFALDRHLALSSNTDLTIPDADICVFVPLAESVWEDPGTPDTMYDTARVLGPPTRVTGTSFLEHFLPLMTILGDVITVHRLSYHPRLGSFVDDQAVNSIAGAIEDCRQSIEELLMLPEAKHSRDATDSRQGTARDATTPCYRHQITAAYSMYILDVLAVLLYGKWDPISMLDDTDGWITSTRFERCSTHSISASGTVSHILTLDPELKLMPYLFGIYLLHGSLVLLLFADRMPQLGLNPSVEQACETLIRAHEVCATTLSTEYQINFRRVFRLAMYRVRGSDAADFDYQKARNILSLYRWVPGARGLALHGC